MSEARVNTGIFIERKIDAKVDIWGNVGLAYMVLTGIEGKDCEKDIVYVKIIRI